MAVTSAREDSIAASLRDYVLGPVSTAEEQVAAEYDEVDEERRAFERFADRIVGIESVSTSGSTPSGRQPGLVRTRSRRIERVRSAYRDTVMSVDHYDEVYGETLEEHAAAELSTDLAAGLHPETGSKFTPLYKRALLAAATNAAEAREAFCDALEEERDSLEAGRTTVETALETLDGTRVQAGQGEEFTDTLDALAQRRQRKFGTRPSPPRADDHDLCDYLYENCDWTYPVLTAVTRLRGTVNGLPT